MENKDFSSQRVIPRLSRLPVPRVVAENASRGNDRNHDVVYKTTKLPRLSTARHVVPNGTPLRTDRHDEVQQPRYRLQSEHIERHASPDRAISNSALSAVEETPLSSFTPPHDDDDGKHTITTPQVGHTRRKPRPSLSERTLETLSQIPPSPSPSRPRPSIAAGYTSMAPPTTPVSSLRSTQSAANLAQRSISPSKTTLRQSGLPTTPSQRPISLAKISDPGPKNLPSRGTGQNSKLIPPRGRDGSSHTKTVQKPTRHVENLHENKHSSQKTRSMYDLKATSTQSSTGNMSPMTTSKELSGRITNRGTGNMRLKTIQNSSISNPEPSRTHIAGSSSSTVSKYEVPAAHNQKSRPQDLLESNGDSKALSKSSIALREAIAKAKAAKRTVNTEPPRSALVVNSGDHFGNIGDEATESFLTEHKENSLQRRIHNAVTSGVLNIAALGLEIIPEAVANMYEFDNQSGINWFEAVDLVRFNAADNKLVELSSSLFPDRSHQELQEDDQVSNQFGGLELLDLHSNHLTMVPVGLRRLANLHTLILNDNQLEVDVMDIFCQIPNLKELYLANNNMKGSIPSRLAELTQLQVLDIHSNAITDLPGNIESLRNLRRMNLSHNNLVDIPLESLEKLPLVEIDLSRNAFSGTLFPHGFSSSKLLILNVANNKLQDISGGSLDLPRLQTLNCDNNQLRKLPSVEMLKDLATLIASANRIENIPEGFTSLELLRNADFSSNDIKVLDAHIANMEKLTILNVSANPLRNRKHLTMNIDDLRADLAKQLGRTSLRNCPDKLEHNESFDSSPTKRQTARYKYTPDNGILNLSSQNLTFIELSLIDLTKPVHTIRLSNNDLTVFPHQLLTHPMVRSSLKSLDVSHNQLLDATGYLLHNVTLPELQSLYIVSTGLTSLKALTTHLSAPALRELNISCHRMTGSVPRLRDWFPSLTALFAADNSFTSLEVETVRGLEVVDVRNNDINYIPPKIGELGNTNAPKLAPGRLRAFECSGNQFRIPRITVLEKGTEATLRDLRRMVPTDQVGLEWQ